MRPLDVRDVDNLLKLIMSNIRYVPHKFNAIDINIIPEQAFFLATKTKGLYITMCTL